MCGDNAFGSKTCQTCVILQHSSSQKIPKAMLPKSSFARTKTVSYNISTNMLDLILHNQDLLERVVIYNVTTKKISGATLMESSLAKKVLYFTALQYTIHA